MKIMNAINCLKKGRVCKSIRIETIAFSFILSIIITSCSFSQSNEKQLNANGNQPKINFKVNKQYDDKGNVIGYDSTYSYSFSDSINSLNHDTAIFRSYSFPNGQFPGSINQQFNPDSIFKNDPFMNGGGTNNDPFSNFNTNPFENMNDMLKQMEELQKQMQQNFQQFQPQPVLPAPNNVPPKPNKPEQQISPPSNPKPSPPDTTGTRVI